MPLIQLLGTEKYNTLTTLLGIDTLSAHEQEDILLLLSQNICARIVVEVAPQLSSDEKDHFSNLMNEGQIEEISTFLESKVSEFDDLMRSVATEEIKEALRGSPKTKN